MAWVTDLFLVVFLIAPPALVLEMVLTSGFAIQNGRLHLPSLKFVLAVVSVALLAYHGILVGLTGQTVGKALFNIRVMRMRKRPPGVVWSTGRALGYIFVDAFGIGSLWALRDSRHRTLHDLVFRSEVVLLRQSPLKARQRMHDLDRALAAQNNRLPLLKRLLKWFLGLQWVRRLVEEAPTAAHVQPRLVSWIKRQVHQIVEFWRRQWLSWFSQFRRR